MKTRTITIAAILVFGLAAGASRAQDGFGPGDGDGVCPFVDEDGDGFNDLAPDHDGDGIPNGLDPDWIKPEDGTGAMHRYAAQYGELLRKFFGEDVVAGMGAGNGHAWGPGDGTGTGVGPQDGTGFGPGPGTGAGDGDGEGDGQNHEIRNQRQGRR